MKALSSIQIVLRIALIAFISEAFIMMGLNGILRSELSTVIIALVDAFILLVLMIPPIYFWVIRPFVMRNREMISQLATMAYIDPLTHVWNRRGLCEALQHESISHDDYGAMILIDVNHFKEINDTYGHQIGDMVLIEVAERLNRVGDSVDAVVARLGGDEFIVMIYDLGNQLHEAQENIAVLMEQLNQVMEEVWVAKQHHLYVNVSAGVQLVKAVDVSTHFDTILRDVDKAMYSAKKQNDKNWMMVNQPFQNTVKA